MRKPFVAGNWKMNKTAAQAGAFVTEILPKINTVSDVEIVICPPFTALMTLAGILKGSSVGLGAQNLHWEASGAYTGETAPSMVKEFCQYVIIGHSERRSYFGETDATVNKKVKAALANQLIPIVCVGETLEENEKGQTEAVVKRQVEKGLEGLTLDQAKTIVVAYEPVWAIGTGRAASGDVAENVHGGYIRPTLKAMFNEEVAQSIRILYGGSVTPANAAEFFGQADVDGALVGGASLKPDFVAIIEAARK